MRTFFNDGNGFTQRDYLLLFVTIFYGAVVSIILYATLKYPSYFSKDMLDFLHDVIESVSASYSVVIVFYFGNHTGTKVIKYFTSKANMLSTNDGVVKTSDQQNNIEEVK